MLKVGRMGFAHHIFILQDQDGHDFGIFRIFGLIDCDRSNKERLRLGLVTSQNNQVIKLPLAYIYQ